MTEGSPLRVALVLPGAVSLGSYEAGALTALLKLVRASNGRIVVDTVVGASAGSVTGLLFAHALLTDKASDDNLRQLWVEQASIQNLLKGGYGPGQARGPLSTRRLERWADRVFESDASRAAATEPIAYVASLANLRGMRYGIAQARGRVVHADTFRDAKAVMLASAADCVAAMPAAVASAANAFAFPPVLLRRHKAEYPANVALSEDEAARGFWYTDGGTVYNMPLGFALEAVFKPDELQIDREPTLGPRLVVLVHPHPSEPPAQWPTDDPIPAFVRTGIRALNMSREQSMFDDLRRLEKTNTRIRAKSALGDTLRQLLNGPGGEQLAESLHALGRERLARRERIKAQIAQSPPAPVGEPDEPAVEIDRLLDEIAGTRGKGLADVHFVSPDLDPSHRHPAELLAGERLGHFFGFAHKGARESDFGLGYYHLRVWWESLPDTADAEIAALLPSINLEHHDLEHHGHTASKVGPWSLPRRTLVLLGLRLGFRYLSEAVSYLRLLRRPPGSRGEE